MAGSINKVILVGNVGRDPEIRNANGKKIAILAIVTSETWRDKQTGEKREKAEWHRVVVFTDGLVNIIENYVKKGAKLYIEGALQTRKWVDNSGAERYSTEIILQGYNASLTMLDARKMDHADMGHDSNEGYHDTASVAGSSKPEFEFDDLEDEIPF